MVQIAAKLIILYRVKRLSGSVMGTRKGYDFSILVVIAATMVAGPTLFPTSFYYPL